MTEYHFDTRDGKLLVGNAAAGHYIDEAGPAIVPLKSLLNIRSLEFPTDHFDTVDTNGWTREDLLAYGHWVCELLTDESGNREPLKERHIDRLRTLGLGASIKTIRLARNFGNLQVFKRELGSPLYRQFDHWVIADYVDFARGLSARLRRKPEEPDYTAAFKNGDCPSYQSFYKRVGMGRLSDYLGYPDIRSWDNDDFVLWGVRVLRANPERGIPPSIIEELSHKKHGPAMKTVANRFGTIRDFQAQVEEELERQDKEAARLHAIKLENYSRMIGQERLSANLLDDIDELLRVGAQRLIIEKCLPNLSEKAKQTLAVKPSKNFTNWVLNTNKELPDERANLSLTAATIEATAISLDVFDDIWPIGKSIDHLRSKLPPNQAWPYRPGIYRHLLEKRNTGKR